MTLDLGEKFEDEEEKEEDAALGNALTERIETGRPRITKKIGLCGEWNVRRIANQKTKSRFFF